MDIKPDPGTQLCVEDVLITGELEHRRTRKPDHEAENRAMTTLAREMALHPYNVLQKLAELVLELCRADSAGVSILETDGEYGIFRWRAAAGPFSVNIGGTMPREASPCGTVITHDNVLLFNEAERFFPALRGVKPHIYESLLAPWNVKSQTIGTVWAIAHSPERHFDAEDARVLQSLAAFASAAYQMTTSLSEADAGRRALAQQVADRTQQLRQSNAKLEKEIVQRRESEERFRRALEINTVGVLYFNLDGRITGGNQALAKMSGYSHEDLNSGDLRWDRLTPSEWIPVTQHSVDELLSTGSSSPFEKEYVKPDGSRWWGLFAGKMLDDRNGVEFVIDITEKKHAEFMLQEREEQHAFLLALSDALRSLSEVEQIESESARALGSHLGAALTFYCEWNGERNRDTVRGVYQRDHGAASGDECPIENFPWTMEELRAGHTIAVSDTAALPREDRALYAALSMKACVALPLLKDGQLVAAIAVMDDKQRTWTRSQVALIEEATERTWSAVGHARADKALRQFATLAESSCEFIGMCDMQLVPFYINTAGLQMVGLDDLEQGRRTPVLEFFFPEDHATIRDTFLPRVLCAGHAEIETRFRHFKTGEALWVIYSVMVLKDAHGKPGAYGTVTRNITQSKLAVAALQESEARFRALADASPALIWQVDAHGNAIYLNQRYLDVTGLTPEQLLQSGWHAILHPDDATGYLASVCDALRERAVLQRRIRIRVKDGSWSWFETHAAPWFSAAGDYRGHVGLSIDIGESMRAEEALKEADRRKDEFLAVLAHELRNPLAPISNAVHLLRRPDGRRKADRLVEMLGRQVHHTVRLVDDLLELSRITRGKIELEKHPLELSDVVRRAVEVSLPLIDQGRHRLAIELPEEPLFLNADSVRLTQVFSNLLNNAAKYTQAEGNIHLNARRDGSHVVISVRDDGIGIPADALPHVFEMFTQVHRSRGQGGLGIGLAMVRKLVQMHGGTAEAHSDGPDRGSEFIVRLPLLEPDIADDFLECGAVASPLSGQRILVVDDNRDAADSLAMLLECEGAKVQAVYSGSAALAAMETLHPHVVLLDLGMPGMDGYEVAQHIREDERYRDVRIAALTGWGQAKERMRTQRFGFDHHMTKPVDFKALEAWLTAG